MLLVVTAATGMALGAWRFNVIDTGSMRPTLNPGDVAMLMSEQPNELRIGQIVAFHPPGEPRLTVMHRVVALERKSHAVVIQTKGDANNAKDPWHARIVGKTVWHENLRVPTVGYLAVFSGQRPVRLGALIMIVALTLSLLLGWIWRPSSR